MEFKLVSEYAPTGDQPKAIEQLTDGLNQGTQYQTLMGVTGSGKTFTVANVIKNYNKPALVLSHNKTLAAQLYSELKAFFPENKVEYFVSYYDYYQPEAYIPHTDTYIEKDLAINTEIEKLRLSTTASLLSGRSDIIVVSSVSCIYGIGNPENFAKNSIHLEIGQEIGRETYVRMLINNQYSRNEISLERGTFRVKGETVDLFLAYEDFILRVMFWGNEIEQIQALEPISLQVIDNLEACTVYPANIFMPNRESMEVSFQQIESDLALRVAEFEEIGKHYEAKRISERVKYDLEMIRELGYCSGIENYSRYFDGRQPGARPFCLLDYFPKDFITIIDESHVTVPQIRAMYGGDAARKQNLVDYGFRLPAARDNRPLKYEEFEQITGKTIYISATPADYELVKSGGVVVEQIIRPTGLLDPLISVRKTGNQIDDLLEEINIRIEREERVLATTLTKRMAEELSSYLKKAGIKCAYIHSDVDTLERVRIMDELRNGVYDVLVGVNLLREGLDLPQVSLVAILDADKEGFLRSHVSLTQTVGRAARHLNGQAIMYADTITKSMQQTIDETARRREIQMKYNKEHNITPKAIKKNYVSLLAKRYEEEQQAEQERQKKIEDTFRDVNTLSELDKTIKRTEKLMKEAAKKMEFLDAAYYRDQLYHLQEKRKAMEEK